MTRHCLFVLIPALLTLASLPAGAETVYRCGNVYAQSPCAAGRAIDVDDTRNVDEHAEARRVAAAERELGDRMERQRLTSEARLRPAGAVSVGPVASRTALAAKPHAKKHRARPVWATSEAIAREPARVQRAR